MMVLQPIKKSVTNKCINTYLCICAESTLTQRGPACALEDSVCDRQRSHTAPLLLADSRFLPLTLPPRPTIWDRSRRRQEEWNVKCAVVSCFITVNWKHVCRWTGTADGRCALDQWERAAGDGPRGRQTVLVYSERWKAFCVP